MHLAPLRLLLTVRHDDDAGTTGTSDSVRVISPNLEMDLQCVFNRDEGKHWREKSSE